MKGFPDAFPQTQVQLCIVHMVRNSMKYVSWKDYKAVGADLKKVNKSATENTIESLNSVIRKAIKKRKIFRPMTQRKR